MVDSRPPPDDGGEDQFDMDEIEADESYEIDEFGIASLTPMEAFEYHLESGRPLAEKDANELVKREVIPKADLRRVEGGFQYVGKEWTI